MTVESSRWIQQFRNHSFQRPWAQIKSSLQEARIDDQSVATSVSELGRLKKAVAYIDGLLSSIDPELVPMGTWDVFGQQCTLCASEISSYNDNKNIGHLQNANAYADNLLSYVRPYMVASGRIAKTLRDSVSAYSEAYSEYLLEFKGKSERILSLAEEDARSIKNEKNRSENIIVELSEKKKILLGDESDAGELDRLEEKNARFFRKA